MVTNCISTARVGWAIQPVKKTMKRILVSVGLAALGASTVSAFADSYTGLDDNKQWSVNLNLRGFYSDNIDTAPKGQSGFGFDINPGARLHLNNSQTDFTAGYQYDAVYYDKRPVGNNSNWDQDHTFDLSLQHQFSERYSLTVGDTFVVGQEPDQLQVTGPFTEPERVSGDNIHNYGTINFDMQVTHLLGLEIGYDNSLWSYASHKFFPTQLTLTNLSSITPSLVGENDRIEQTVHLDSHWSVTPSTVLILGYQFTDVDYTGNQPIQVINPLMPIAPHFNVYYSSVRDSHSHYGYVGATHEFLPNLTGSIKIGARYTENYNDPNDTVTVAPYVSMNISYNYAKESYVQLGFTHDMSANDHAGGSGTNIVQDSDTSVVFGTVHQRLTPKLYATFTGTFQDAVVNAPGSPLDGEEDRYYLLALDFEYKFTHNFSMHTGYTYDRLETGKSLAGTSTGSYDKSTIYLGATISY